MKKLFTKSIKNILDKINLFRFNTLFAIHQKATALKPYKWWSELKLANSFHVFILVVYMLGMGSGFYLALPKGSEAAYVPQRALYENTGTDIFGYDLATGTEIPISISAESQESPAIYGNKVVWQDNRNGDTDIYLADITNSNTFTNPTNLTPDTIGTYQESPAIYGNKVIWYDNRGGNGYDIYLADITDPNTFINPTNLTPNTAGTNQSNPVISGNKIVWEDFRSGSDFDIYLADITDSTTFTNPTNLTPDTTGTNQEAPFIDGNKVVWHDYRSIDTDIYLADITDPNTFNNPTNLTPNTVGTEQTRPIIFGNRVVWEDFRSFTDTDIYLADITDPTTFTNPVNLTMNTAGTNQYSIAIYGEMVVWTDGRYSNIYAYEPAIGEEWTVFTDDNAGGIYAVNNSTSAVLKISPFGYNPAIYGNKVVWADSRSGTDNDIYLADITDPNTFTNPTKLTPNTVGTNQYGPAIYGNNVVWQDSRSGTDNDIYLADITNPNTFTSPTNLTPDTIGTEQQSPVIYGNRVVWQDYRSGTDSDIYLADITDPNTFTNPINLTPDTIGTYQQNPAIHGNKVVWTDNRNGTDDDIYLADITDPNTFTNPTNLTPDTIGTYQSRPTIFGDNIVWEDPRNRSGELYITEIDATSPVFSNLPNTVTKINISANQIIRTSPLNVKTKPTDDGSGIQKVEYYIDDTLMATDDTADANGVYGADLDLTTAPNKEGGVTLKALAYDNAGNTAEHALNIIPDPWYFSYLTVGSVTPGSTNYQQYKPDISGDRVVWYDSRNGNSDIFLADISDLNNVTESQITLDTNSQSYPRIDGDKIVWVDNRNGNNDVYMYDLTIDQDSDGTPNYLESPRPEPDLAEVQITSDGSSQNYPVIDENVVAWQDSRNGSSDIYIADVTNISEPINEIQITSGGWSKTDPDISGSKIVWTDFRSGNYDVYMYDLTIDQDSDGTPNYLESSRPEPDLAEVQITSDGSSQRLPSVSDTKITWQDSRGEGTNRLYIYDLEQGQEILVSTDPSFRYVDKPKISGDHIVYHGHGDIYNNCVPKFYSLSTGAKRNIVPERDSDWIYSGPVMVDGNTVVWDSYGENKKIWYAKFENIDIYSPEQITLTPTTGDAGKSINLAVSAWDNVEAVKAEISLDFGPFIELNKNAPVAKDGGKTTNFFKDLTLPFKDTANYALKVTDIGGNVTTVTGTFTINSAGTVVNETKTTVQQTASEVAEETTPTPETEEITEDDQGEDEDNQDELKTFIENFKDFFVTLFTNPKEIGKKISTKVLGAFTDAVDTAVQIIKETPPAVANTFPYILFILLGIMASVFFFQAQSEARQSRKLLDILTMEKAIYEDKENFLTLSAHYLRTPATIITGGIDLISEKNQTIKAKLAPIAKSLTTEIQSILKSIEDNSYLAHIKKPELDKEKRFLLLSPFLLVPILLVAGTAIIANLLFIRVAEINISTVNLIAEILIFVIVVQVLVTFARHRYTERRNRKEYEQTLSYERNIDKARNKFVDEVGTKITPYISNIDKHLPKGSDKAVESIREGKHRLSDILYKFSLLSQSTKGGFRLIHPATVSLKTQAKVALSISEKDIKAKEIKIKEDLGSIELKTDPRKIEFIMSSLISNAIKFTNPKTTIDISATKQGKKTTITVTDEGPGISEEGKLHLFKPFTRTTSALNFDYEGFGLSLYLSKILINSLGGDISLDSKEGKGTTVRVEV